jgi:threonylcarbamoyladenosine tRNA methylthiotransferase MtaB
MPVEVGSSEIGPVPGNTERDALRPLRVFLKTYGCRANQYDSESVRALIEQAGGRIVPTAAEADVAVFNSCAVTREAEVDLRKGVRRAARTRPGLRSVIMGCASALDQGDLRTLPTVDTVVAGADLAAVAAALAIPGPLAPARLQSGTRALLRIQDGCDEHCTFCATTLARGANRSRATHELVGEASALAGRHPEIVLTGIHIGTWGRDIGSSLGELVQALMSAVPAVRFRLSSVEASEVDERLEEAFAHPRQLVPHLHAPLQSGSATLLRRMGRHWYTPASYASAIERLARPVFALGADVIAGFPGEAEADHDATARMIRELPFTYLHVFPYSLRPGTAAERLPGHLPREVIERRAAELRALAKTKADAYMRERLAGSADVVTIGGPALRGLTEDYLSVRVPVAGATRGARFDGRIDGTPGALTAVPLGQP